MSSYTEELQRVSPTGVDRVVLDMLIGTVYQPVEDVWSFTHMTSQDWVCGPSFSTKKGDHWYELQGQPEADPTPDEERINEIVDMDGYAQMWKRFCAEYSANEGVQMTLSGWAHVQEEEMTYPIITVIGPLHMVTQAMRFLANRAESAEELANLVKLLDKDRQGRYDQERLAHSRALTAARQEG